MSVMDTGPTIEGDRHPQELAHFLGREARETRERGNTLPWDVWQSIRQRVAALREQARDLLGVAAVIGREAGVAVLLDVAGIPADDVVVALDESCRARLLVEHGRDGHQFAHDLIQEENADLDRPPHAFDRRGEFGPKVGDGFALLEVVRRSIDLDVERIVDVLAGPEACDTRHFTLLAMPRGRCYREVMPGAEGDRS